jgi:hypothetical protein
MRALLALVQSHGGGEIAAAEVDRALAKDGAGAGVVLAREGIVRGAPLATTHPCDAPSCAREVREAAETADGARRFLAVCTRSPRECETLRLREPDLAQRTIAIDALVGAVMRELGVEGSLGREAKRALGGALEPVALGEQTAGSAVRDVFFARRPGALALRALLAERRAAARPALVLVPTARAVKPEVLAAHAVGHVQIVALADVLSVEGGRLSVADHVRDVPRGAGAKGARVAERGAHGAAPAGVLAKLPRAARWSQVAFYRVHDDHLLGVEIDRRTRRVAARDLGMAVATTGEPVRAYTLLQRICDGNGVFDTRPWGSQANGKKVVSELRAALTKAFGIEESPIETYSRGTRSWKTRFRAYASAPVEVRAMLREVEERGRSR